MYRFGSGMFLVNPFVYAGGAPAPAPEFIMLVKTDNPGTTASDQFLIKTASGSYNYDVDWGDNTTSTGVTGDITHTYASAGTYTVKISGSFPRLYGFGSADIRKVIDILNWGDIVWGNSLEWMLYNSTGLTTLSATDIPDFSNTTSLSKFFRASTNFVGGGNIENWDVSNISIFDSFFEGTKFNADINAWDVSSAINMLRMFYAAYSFNQNIGSWDVSSVTDMTQMFSSAYSFNQDISSWDVSSVASMGAMFFLAGSFNQNLGIWDISSVWNMASIFAHSGMSTANYTDTIVGWANYVFTNGVPLNVNMSTQTGRTFDTSRSGGANFANAGAARTYLTTATPTGAGWTISGDTVI